MNVSEQTSGDMTTPGGEALPPSIGLAPDALPEVQKPQLAANSQTGVSTRNTPLPKEIQEARRAARVSHWYVLRCTYGREKSSAEYLKTQNFTTYSPTEARIKLINGRRKTVVESFFPNLIFVYGKFEELKTYVYNNEHKDTKPLRFYYHRYHEGTECIQTPLTITDKQMESIRKTCSSGSADIIVSPKAIPQFEKGKNVRVIDGKFKGVEGKVARYQGQQRVAIIIEGACTLATAYVPSAFLEQI